MTAEALPVGEGSSVEYDFFGRIPRAVWRRPDISLRAKNVLGALTILARSKTGWIRATQAEIASECGVSTRTVQRGIAELVRSRIVDWDSIGSNFVLEFRLRGPGMPASVEGPILSPPPDRSVAPLYREREESRTEKGGRSFDLLGASKRADRRRGVPGCTLQASKRPPAIHRKEK